MPYAKDNYLRSRFINKIADSVMMQLKCAELRVAIMSQLVRAVS